MPNRATHNQLVLDYMRRHGSITPAEALEFSCFRLSARIYDLRREGYVIEAQRVPIRRACGAFARYSLRSPPAT